MMCDRSCIQFAKLNIKEEEVKGKSVIEVGSLDVNGSVRPIVEAFTPSCYVGVDIQMGPGVDEICDANKLLERFGPNSFEVLISTELLEHVRNWRRVISNFKSILTPSGVLLISTRSRGFVYHGYPFDYWRFEISDMEKIFTDFRIEKIEKDIMLPGLLLKAVKPTCFIENDTKDIHIYSVIKGCKIKEINDIDILWFRIRHEISTILLRILPTSIKNFIKRCYKIHSPL